MTDVMKFALYAGMILLSMAAGFAIGTVERRKRHRAECVPGRWLREWEERAARSAAEEADDMPRWHSGKNPPRVPGVYAAIVVNEGSWGQRIEWLQWSGNKWIHTRGGDRVTYWSREPHGDRKSEEGQEAMDE